MNFKIITSLNKRLFEHRTQQLINSALEQKYPVVLYHENSYENKEDYLIWCDGDAYFPRPLDEMFWDFTKQHDISCIWRDFPHIETGFVVYKINDNVKRAMREYLGWFTTGEIWKTSRYCDCSALTHVVKNNPHVKVGKYKNFEWNGPEASEFNIVSLIAVPVPVVPNLSLILNLSSYNQ